MLHSYYSFLAIFSFAPHVVCYNKSIAPNVFALSFVLVLHIGTWLHFCIALYKVNAVPAIATAIIISLSCSLRQYKIVKEKIIDIAFKVEGLTTFTIIDRAITLESAT